MKRDDKDGTRLRTARHVTYILCTIIWTVYRSSLLTSDTAGSICHLRDRHGGSTKRSSGA